MSDAQKLNSGLSLNKAARAKALDHIHLTGKNLPASIVSKKGSIVTVKFETGGVYTLPNVTIPMHMPEWTRLPMQKGDKGVVWAGDVNISSMTGLGPNSPPSFTRPGNLAPLTFIPVGNTNFFKVDDDKHVNYGKSGAQIADQGFKSFVGTDASGTGSTLKGSTPTGTPDPTNITAATFKHSVTTDDTNGVQHTSTKKVGSTAPKVDVNASDSHNITSPKTNISGDAAISGNAAIAGALSAASAILGNMKGAGGAPASMPAGAQLGGASTTNPALAIAYQYVTPTTGNTVTILINMPVTIIDPAGRLAALTLAFPTGVDGAMLWLSFSQQIDVITITGATFGPSQSFTNIPIGGGSVRYFFVAGTVNKWYRV